MAPPYLMVTIVSEGGTPFQLCNQRGGPYPTTGIGALVFNVDPIIYGGTFHGSIFDGVITFPELLKNKGDLISYDGEQAIGIPMGDPGSTLVSTATGLKWQTGTPGTVTQIDRGTGILLTPNPIIDSGTVAVDTAVIATKVYVDNSISAIPLGNYLLKSGGTMTGAIVLPGNPAAALAAAPKQYVDGLITGQGLPSGGIAGQYLTKSSNANYAAQWSTLPAFEPSITAGLTTQYWRGDKSWQILDKATVGLGNVTNVQQQPLDGDLTALSALTGTNTIYYRSAPDTWSPVTMGGNMTFTGGTLNSTGGGGASVTISDTAPVAPVAGNLWWKSDIGQLQIYYTDPTPNSYWVPAAPAPSLVPNNIAAQKLTKFTANGTFTRDAKCLCGYVVGIGGGGGSQSLSGSGGYAQTYGGGASGNTVTSFFTAAQVASPVAVTIGAGGAGGTGGTGGDTLFGALLTAKGGGGGSSWQGGAATTTGNVGDIIVLGFPGVGGGQYASSGSTVVSSAAGGGPGGGASVYPGAAMWGGGVAGAANSGGGASGPVSNNFTTGSAVGGAAGGSGYLYVVEYLSA